MELSQRLDLGKLGLDATPSKETAPLEGDALAQLAGLLVQVGAIDDADEVKGTDTLDSLGVDSLTRIELAVRAEEHFGVQIDEELWSNWATLNDAASHFDQHS
nr:acyl carrier protein [Streptococcus thermophilus]